MPANPQESAPGGVPSPGALPRTRQIAALLGFLAVSWIVATLGSVPIILNSNGWYALADKAPWTPPGWMFGSVWTALYAAMAVAAWLVWRQRAFPRRAALKAYAVLIVLNLAWPMMFFGMYPIMGAAALWLALLIITAHTATATVTVLRFGPISTGAGLLMLPYVSWLVFSTSLNVYAAVNN